MISGKQPQLLEVFNACAVLDKKTPERFWSKVETPSGIGECWMWKGAINGDGYASFGVRSYEIVAGHRFAYQLVFGDVPKGKELDHLCKNRACVNPYHLEPVEHKENLLRGDSPSARHARQTHCKNGHPLTEDNIAEFGKKRGRRDCKICHKERHKAYSDSPEGREKIREYQRKWYHLNKARKKE